MHLESDAPSPRRVPRWVGLALFSTLVFWYFLGSSAEAPNGDAAAPFMGAIRLIKGYGILDSKVMPGQTFLMVPFAVASRWVVRAVPDPARHFPLMILVTDLFPAIMTAGTAVIVYRAGLVLGYSAAAAVGAALVFALATPAAVYSKHFFPQTSEAFFLIAAIYGALVARRHTGVRAARRALVLSGLAFAACLLVKLVGIVCLPALALLVAGGAARGAGNDADAGGAARAPARWRLDRDAIARLLWWATPVFLLTLLYLPYNAAARGNAFNFGYGLERDAYWGFATNTFVGVHGLLFSPGKGVFWYAPVLALAIPGIARIARRDRVAAIAFVIACAAPLLFHAHWWAWHGDNAWGPRYLVPVMPVAALAATEMLRGPRRSARSWALPAALIASSAAIQILGGAFINNAYQTVTYDTVIPQYRPEHGANGPRDDEVHLHWIPEFSPLVGHLWLARHALRGDPASEYARDYPWRALRPDGEWAPRVPEPPPPLDYWVMRFPGLYPKGAGVTRIVAIATAAGLAIAAACLVRAVRAARAA